MIAQQDGSETNTSDRSGSGNGLNGTLWSALCVIFLTCSAPAYAYTDVCVGPATVTNVSTLIRVPPGKEFESFVSYLRKFALQKQYVIEPNAGTEDVSADGRLDLILLKRNTAEAIHISNRNRVEEIEASMSECGSEKFKPYWKEFMTFVKRYVATRPDYPL